MDQDKFQRFLTERFEPERQRYRQRARVNQQSYKGLLWGLTICSIVSAMAVSLEAFFDWLPLKAFAALFTIIVTGLATALKTFGFQEKATLYHRAWNELDNEWDLYQAGAEHYAEADDKERYFITRIRAFLNQCATTIPNMTLPPPQKEEMRNIS